MIPELDAHGLLPAGVHDCTWWQLRTRFAATPHRRGLLLGLCRFIRSEVRPLGLPASSVLVDGSFVRAKPQPQDIDIVLDASGCSPAQLSPVLVLFLDRVRIKREHQVDFWVRHPLLPNDLGVFFQYLGDEAASQLGLAPRWPKGILRIST